MRRAYSLLFLLFLGVGGSFAAVQSCESSPAVRAAERNLGQQLESLTFDQSMLLQETAYQKIMALDPLDFRPLQRHIIHVKYEEPEKWHALRDQLVADAKAHPQEAMKLSAAAVALHGEDTPEAFRLEQQAIAVNPDYAPAVVEMITLYDRSGKYADKDKAAAYLEKYYELCPSGRDEWAANYLKRLGSNELRTRVAANLRKRLQTESDSYVLQSYSDVWSLEFSALPISEHPRERQRISEDLTHLQSLHVKDTPEWLNFLKDGYKQSGAPEDQVKAIEGLITKEFPHSDAAFSSWYQNWKDEHTQPAGEASATEWQRYMHLALAHFAEVPRLFPNEHGFGYYSVEYSAHLDGTSNDEILRLGEDFIKDGDLYEGPSSWSRRFVAGVLLDRDIAPARALELLQQAKQLQESPRERVSSETPDYAKPKDIDNSTQDRILGEAEFRVLYLRACRGAQNKSAAEQIKSEVEAAPPSYEKALPAYWNARAILAEIEGRNTDSLAFYQKVLFLREAPQKKYGVLNDTLLSDARRVWTESQGSEAAFAIWTQPANAAKAVLAEGRWEKPDKELPAFELTDLRGKTWKLKQLEGKKVLINIWATWCGPCQSELPHLEKLYEQTKDRSDVAILSLNFDEDIGMVQPFVTKKNFTFPVLPAYAFLANKIDVDSIPRNWLVDANGKWQWEQIGFDSTEPDWEKSMLVRLEGTK